MARMRRIIKKIALILILLLGCGLGFGETALTDLIEEYRLSCSYEPLRNLIILSKAGRRIVFRPGETWGVLDYSKIIILGPTERKEGMVFLSDDAAGAVLEILGKTPEGRHRIAAIIIDPGHGGKDPGANHIHTVEGRQIKTVEKEIVLFVSKFIYDDLKAAFPDKQVILTRSEDLFLTLEDRTEIANQVNVSSEEAIIFVSIHANASLNPHSSGFEVWYLPTGYRREILDSSALDPASKELHPILNTMLEEEITVESIILADEISSGMEGAIGNLSENRGLKEESWFVVRKAKMPSVLVEIGFLTNTEEAVRLTEPSYLQKIAKGIYNGIYMFVDSFERTSGFTEP